MRFRFILFLVLALFSSAAIAVVAQEKDGLTAEFSKCIDKASGTDPAMLDCIEGETKRQDKRLNDVYKKLMNKLDTERKKQLLEAQRLWIKYTEANCSFYLDPDGGTAARLSASECPMLAKARRATELESFLE